MENIKITGITPEDFSDADQALESAAQVLNHLDAIGWDINDIVNMLSSCLYVMARNCDRPEEVSRKLIGLSAAIISDEKEAKNAARPN